MKLLLLAGPEHWLDFISIGRVLLLIITLGLSGSAMAEPPATPAPHHSLGIEVAITATGGKSALKQGSSVTESIGAIPYSSSDSQTVRDKKSGISMEVSVRNLSKAADTAELEVFFIGKSVTGKEPFIFDSSNRSVTVAAGREEKVAIASKELSNHEETRLHRTDAANALGQPIPDEVTRRKSGSKLVGWIVRIVAEGKVLDLKASSPELEAVGRNDAKLEAFSREGG